jgi:hypothetical protein
MLTATWIGFRVHRFEIITAVLMSAIVAVTAAIVTLHLKSAAALVPAGCWDSWFTGTSDVAASCDGPIRAFLDLSESEAGRVMAAMAVLPFIVGLLVGVPLVGQELEARTAETAWSLAGSRRRWLANLSIPGVVLVLVAVGVAAAAATIVAMSLEPWHAGTPGWADVGLYGPIVVARGAAAFGVGLLAGAVIGRTLPALIVAVVGCVLIVFLATGARTAWMYANQQLIDARNGFSTEGAVLLSGQMFIDASGAVLTPDEAYARIPPGTSDQDQYPWLLANMREVYYGVPASAVPAWERLEVIGLGAATAVMLVGTFVVVERRRPR